MKKVMLTFIALALHLVSGAQTSYTKSLNGIERVQIHSGTDIILKAHQNDQLLIKGGKKEEVPEEAKGLKLVGPGGNDNTGVGYFIEQNGNTLVVWNLSREGKAEIFLPVNQDVSVVGTGLNDIHISGFKGEVEATAQIIGNITIKDVTGPLTVNSNTGQIAVIFSELDQDSPTTVTSTTGNLDITLPEDTPATVTINSVMGEVYSDFDFQLPEKKGLKPVSTQKIKGSLNGGGGLIQLHSATGNIFLRKQ